MKKQPSRSALMTEPKTDEWLEHAFACPDLHEWVRTQIARGCISLVLRQRVGEGEILISSWELPGEGPDRIALAIDRRAQNEGRSLRGPTLFFVYAIRDVGREHVDRLSFRMMGETFGRGCETEEPNSQGITSMLMRHAEGATKIALGHTASIIDHYQNLLAQAQRRIAELELALNETAAMREALLTLNHERAIEEQKAKLDDKKSDFIREKLDLLLPVIASKLLGQGAAGPPPILTDEAMRQFLGSMSEDQMGKLMSVLSPDQQAVVGELYLRYAQRAKDGAVADAAKQASAS